VTTKGSADPHPYRSFIVTTILTAVLALVGWLAAEATEPGPRNVQLAGTEIELPAGWVVDRSAPGVLGTVSDPFDPFARLEIAEASGADAAAAAADFLNKGSDRLAFFHVVDESLTGERASVEYRFVATDPAGRPAVLFGRTEFVATADGLRSIGVITRETDTEDAEAFLQHTIERFTE